MNRSNPMIQTGAHTERVSVGKVNRKFECAEILLSCASLGGMFGAALLVFPIDTLQHTTVFLLKYQGCLLKHDLLFCFR